MGRLNLVPRLLDAAARTLHRMRSRCRRRETEPSRPLHPNDGAEWEAIYATPVVAVTGLQSEVARRIASLTREGEALLEAGCGSGALSAELALSGRKVVLVDFSSALLDRAKEVFKASGLEEPRTIVADVTKTWPIENGSVDVVWSSGTLEHWTDDEMVHVLREMARVARRAVISYVPRASCFMYRLGKAVAERDGCWPYGREIPRDSLRKQFESAGLFDIAESPVEGQQGTRFLPYLDAVLADEIREWWEGVAPDDPLRRSQAELLETFGRVASSMGTPP